MNDHAEDFIPVGERMWNDILASEDVRGKTLEWRISKLVMKLVRHLHISDRETDGAIHWKSMGPKQRHAFQKEDGHTLSLILIDLIISGKEAIKLDFNIARTPTTSC